MRNLSRFILVLVLLLMITSVATAGAPELEPFSTTGYTTDIEFEPLPSGDTKFHLVAQGETGGFFDGGAFTFEEWGVYYPETEPVYIPSLGLSVGANHGLLNVITNNQVSMYSGEVNMRFGGQAIITDLSDPYDVSAIGSFAVINGTADYINLKGQGTYEGDADYVFTVDYTPCEGKNCPDQCAAFGSKRLKVKKDKVEWRIENEGKNDLTVNSVTLSWLGSDVPLDKVIMGGKTLENSPAMDVPDPPIVPGHYSIIDLSNWGGEDRDIQVRSGKNAKLTFNFDDKGISQETSDYTILVEFAEGCAFTFVDFPPPAP